MKKIFLFLLALFLYNFCKAQSAAQSSVGINNDALIVYSDSTISYKGKLVNRIVVGTSAIIKNR